MYTKEGRMKTRHFQFEAVNIIVLNIVVDEIKLHINSTME